MSEHDEFTTNLGAARVGAPPLELDGTGAPLFRYVYASMAHSPDYVVNASGAVYRVVRDQLGSPLLIVNTTTPTDVLLDARYTAFGTRTTDVIAAVAPTLGYAGGIYDEDTGLTRFGARDYDAMVGRWTAKDPILWGGGQGNLYVYVGNEPINVIDPRGEFAWALAACLGGGCEAAATAAATALTWTAATVAAAWVGTELGDALQDWFAKKRDIKEIERLVKDYDLTRDERRRLHDAITKEGLDIEAIAAEAEDIVRGRRRDRDKRQGCPEK